MVGVGSPGSFVLVHARRRRAALPSRAVTAGGGGGMRGVEARAEDPPPARRVLGDRGRLHRAPLMERRPREREDRRYEIKENGHALSPTTSTPTPTPMSVLGRSTPTRSAQRRERASARHRRGEDQGPSLAEARLEATSESPGHQPERISSRRRRLALGAQVPQRRLRRRLARRLPKNMHGVLRQTGRSTPGPTPGTSGSRARARTPHPPSTSVQRGQGEGHRRRVGATKLEGTIKLRALAVRVHQRGATVAVKAPPRRLTD